MLGPLTSCIDYDVHFLLSSVTASDPNRSNLLYVFCDKFNIWLVESLSLREQGIDWDWEGHEMLGQMEKIG